MLNRKSSRRIKNGFTLVELLAVIVILAIILVIAVPKIMSVIEDAKKATLESTAKMIASQAEKQKVQNTVLGKTDEITCESVAKINDVDYKDCDIAFDNNTAKVTIQGSGKFEELYVCNGTKTEAKATDEECDVNNNEDTIILPEIGITAEDCTWEEISAIGRAGKADEYFNLGDTKTITIDGYGDVVMEMVAFNEDDLGDGSGKAAISWMATKSIASHAMNSTGTKIGGWEASELRSWLQTDIYNALDAEVKNAIVDVYKTYFDYDYGNMSTKTCVDDVWIPSYRELFGDDQMEISGPDYTDYLVDAASRAKYDYSWLRTTDTGAKTSYFFIVYNGGYTWSADADRDNGGVVLGFCT